MRKTKTKKKCLPDERVNVLGLDVVEGLDGVLDLALVRLDVDDEHEGVVVLDLLHRALGRQGKLDDAVLGHPRCLCVHATAVCPRTSNVKKTHTHTLNTTHVQNIR